eukprot:Macronucleus_4240.p1 GENE.Macronucleus_4240~~Macronucleus_4240.p1  ORF type:complete len:176 (+),score=62.16 Macronucleus_4240:1-528(+)
MSKRGTSNMSAAKASDPVIDAEEEQELREAFDLFDRDGDQSIAAKELQVVMQAIGRQKEVTEIEEEIRAIKQAQSHGSDIDEDDLELDLPEFISYISKEMQEREVKEELVEAYQKFVGSDDSIGGITLQQLQETMMAYGEKRLSQQDFEMLFDETDHDGDGLLNFEDFVRMMMSK